MIKNIIFDFGGVLLNLNPDLTYDRLSDYFGAEKKAELDKILLDIELGNLMSEGFVWKLQKLSKGSPKAQELIEAWNAMLLDFPAENLAMLKELKAKDYGLYLLSNTNEVHIKKVMEDLLEKHGVSDFTNYFDGVIYSHEVHMRKPNRDIFEHTLNIFELDKVESLFIDDTIENVNAAKNVGIHAVLHTRNDPISQSINKYIDSI